MYKRQSDSNKKTSAELIADVAEGYRTDRGRREKSLDSRLREATWKRQAPTADQTAAVQSIDRKMTDTLLQISTKGLSDEHQKEIEDFLKENSKLTFSTETTKSGNKTIYIKSAVKVPPAGDPSVPTLVLDKNTPCLLYTSPSPRD